MFRRLAVGWIVFCLTICLPVCAQTPKSPIAFNRSEHLKHGINTSIWFAQSPGHYEVERLRNFTEEKDLRLIAKLGFDHIRLSIDAVPLTSWQHGEPGGKAFVTELDRVVDAALADKLAVIIDIHPEDSYKQGLLHGDENIVAFKELWRAVAEHFASKDADHVFFELLNEPEQTDAVRWHDIESEVASTIRGVDQVHTLIATGAHWSGLEDLLAFAPLNDPNVIYTFHFYEPFAFTHQGATWSMSELKPLRNVPYPATPQNIEPLLPQEPTLSSKFFLEKYALDHWDAKRIDAVVSFAEQWSKTYSAPVYCGEFGAFGLYADKQARERWIHDSRAALEHHHIGWAMWDYQTEFGLVSKQKGETSVDKGVLHALGLKE